MTRGTAALSCPSCGAALSRPVSRVPDPRLIPTSPWGTRVPPGTWAPAGASSTRGVTVEGVWIHPDDLVAENVVPSGFGCCGYSPREGPNLRCRCGRAVGVLVDECSSTLEVVLTARWTHESRGGPEAPMLAARLGRALAELDPAALAANGTPRFGETTRWGVTPDALGPATPAEPYLALRSGPGGPVAELLHGDARRWLPLGPLVLARAIALGRLPVGSPGLSVSHDLLDRGRVLEDWCLVRFDEHVHVRQGGVGPTLAVPAAWLDCAWQEAVDAWWSGGT